MPVSKEEVLKITHLARLEFSAAEIEKQTTQLSAILDYVRKLNELKIEGVEPTAHAVLVPTPFRADEVVQNQSQQKSLKNAPDREGDFFKVPRVIT